LDRPNVIAYHRRLAVAGPTGLVKRVVFDIVVNAVQVRPGQAAAFDRFLARLEQGIVDSNLEALLAPENVPAVSAADLYRRSASQGVQWATLRGGAGGAQPDWGQVNLPEDARARIAKELAAGCVAVAAVIVMFAFAGAAAGAGAKGLVGFMAGSNGVVAGAGVSISCNAISGLMS